MTYPPSVADTEREKRDEHLAHGAQETSWSQKGRSTCYSFPGMSGALGSSPETISRTRRLALERSLEGLSRALNPDLSLLNHGGFFCFFLRPSLQSQIICHQVRPHLIWSKAFHRGSNSKVTPLRLYSEIWLPTAAGALPGSRKQELYFKARSLSPVVTMAES